MDVCMCPAVLLVRHRVFYSQTDHLFLTLGLWTTVREGQQMGEGRMERGEEDDMAKYVTEGRTGLSDGNEFVSDSIFLSLFLKVQKQKLKHIISLSNWLTTLSSPCV